MNYYALGKRIREERKKLNLTQEQLAEDIDITAPHVGQIERGERGVSLDTLVNISNRLGVTVDYLLSDSVDSNDDNLANIWVQLMNDRTPKEKELAINMIKLLFNYIK